MVRIKPNGFTLIELLVVITIVAILGGIGSVVYNRVQVSGRQVECASNMRQIGTALLLYATEHNGNFPETSHSGDREGSWIYSLEDYLGRIDEVRMSPADPHRKDRLEEDGTSYTLNSIVFNPTRDRYGNVLTRYNNLNLLDQPAKTMLMAIVSDQKRGTSADHTHSETWTNWTAVQVDISTDRHRVGNGETDGTKGKSNYLYADGHVESIHGSQFKNWIEEGINPAMPPE